MVHRDQLSAYLQNLFKPYWISEGHPNGLQVEGRPEIRHIVGGVTASVDLIEQAIIIEADALLVHHGWFWEKESRRLEGYRIRRLKKLLAENLSLFAYHLPLDLHPVLGNNKQLALRMDWEMSGEMKNEQGAWGGVWGTPKERLSAESLYQNLTTVLGRVPLWEGATTAPPYIDRLAWCTGAGQKSIELARDYEATCFITGESSESTVHYARENGLHFFAAGHHATERFGIQALGAHIAHEFQCQFTFLDLFNPV